MDNTAHNINYFRLWFAPQNDAHNAAHINAHKMTCTMPLNFLNCLHTCINFPQFFSVISDHPPCKHLLATRLMCIWVLVALYHSDQFHFTRPKFYWLHSTATTTTLPTIHRRGESFWFLAPLYTYSSIPHWFTMLNSTSTTSTQPSHYIIYNSDFE